MSNSLLTKKALAASLKKLMARQKLNKITVNDIAADSGVNRQTFYYHFHDIFELLGWIYQTEALESIGCYKSYDTWGEGFRRVFHYIETNRGFCLNTLESLGRNHLDDYLYSVTSGLIMGVVNEIPGSGGVAETDKQFIVNFYTLAFTGLIVQWMRNGMQESPELIVRKLQELIKGHFPKAVETFCDGS